jgi:hypothetical protein
MGVETREPMVDVTTSHGVSFALLQGQLLAGEISRSAFLDRASPLGAGTSEAAAVASCRAGVARQDREFALNKDTRNEAQIDLLGVDDGIAGSPLPLGGGTLYLSNISGLTSRNNCDSIELIATRFSK